MKLGYLIARVCRLRLGRVSLVSATFVIVGLILHFPHLASAATVNCNGGDVGCLIAAINTANSNGQDNTIVLTAGTFTLTTVNNSNNDGPNGLPSITSKLTIVGAGADLTIITRPSSAPAFRFLYVASTGNLTITGLTLTNGNGGSGAIYNAGGVVTVAKSTLIGNSGATGGAMGTHNGAVTITESIFADNICDCWAERLAPVEAR